MKKEKKQSVLGRAIVLNRIMVLEEKEKMYKCVRHVLYLVRMCLSFLGLCMKLLAYALGMILRSLGSWTKYS